MKFQIHWIEWHNPYNWSDDNISAVEEYANGIKNILDSLPNSKHSNTADDGWIEVECFDTFEADNLTEAKIKAKEYDCGTEQIFTVTDENRNRLFTEEDSICPNAEENKTICDLGYACDGCPYNEENC